MENKDLLPNIGGVIEFDDTILLKKKDSVEHFRNGSFFLNGRSALFYIIKELKNKGAKEINLPLFCCDSIIKTAQKTKLKLKFYSLNKNLEPKITPINGSIVLVINYFGRSSSFINNYEKTNNKKFYLIEDASHSFLNNLRLLEKKKHYVYFSMRKHTHLNIGGWANSKACEQRTNNLISKSFLKTKDVLKRKKKFLKSNKYIEYENYFLNYFENNENKTSSIFSNETLPKTIIREFQLINWEKIKKSRRENWKTLNGLLMKNYKGIFNKIKKDEIPIGFILLVKNRDKLRKYLFKKRIFTSVHWKLSIKANKKKFNFENMLSNHILTIPIDQRYSLKEMKYIANCLNESGIK